jgi:hypothetical protein
MGNVIANAFRYKDWLISTGHSVNEAVKFGLPNKPGKFDLNLIHSSKRFDFAVYQPKLSDFSNLQITSLKKYKRPGTNSSIEVRGYMPEKGSEAGAHGYVKGVCMSGRGSFFHDASTVPGMSGSPVFSSGRLVGMHIGNSESGYNVLVSFTVIAKYLEPDEIFIDRPLAPITPMIMVQESLRWEANEAREAEYFASAVGYISEYRRRQDEDDQAEFKHKFRSKFSTTFNERMDAIDNSPWIGKLDDDEIADFIINGDYSTIPSYEFQQWAQGIIGESLKTNVDFRIPSSSVIGTEGGMESQQTTMSVSTDTSKTAAMTSVPTISNKKKKKKKASN